MKVITFEDIKKLNISPRICFEWASEMIAQKNDCMLPPKIHVNMKNSRVYSAMPAILPYEASDNSWGG